MTEKRFTYIYDATTGNWELHDNLLSCATSGTNAIGITRLLNELSEENDELKSTNMEMEDYLARLEEANINLQIKLQKIRDYAKEDGEVKQGIIEKVILNE